jgi:hypothetical protein
MATKGRNSKLVMCHWLSVNCLQYLQPTAVCYLLNSIIPGLPFESGFSSSSNLIYISSIRNYMHTKYVGPFRIKRSTFAGRRALMASETSFITSRLQSYAFFVTLFSISCLALLRLQVSVCLVKTQTE